MEPNGVPRRIQPMRRLLLVAFLVVLSACHDLPLPPIVSPPSSTERLETAREKWAANGYEHYRYEYVRNCFCRPEDRGPFGVVVTDGEAGAVQFGQPTDADAWSVEELFDMVEKHLADGERVDVTYHQRLGHPMTVALDLDAIAADGGFSIEISDLFGYDDLEAELRSAMQRWADRAPEPYRLTYQPSCFCIPEEVDAVVTGGVPVPEFNSSDTVDELFAVIKTAIADGYVHIEAEFHPTLGHPTHISYDIARQLADDEWAALDIVVSRVAASDQEKELQAAGERWAAAELEHYRYDYTSPIDGADLLSGPYYAIHRDSTTQAYQFGKPIDIRAWSVDDLFQLIARHLEAGTGVKATYDADLGHPTELVTEDGLSMSINHLIGYDAVADALAEGIRRWTAAEVDPYRLTYVPQCFCPAVIVDVVVTGGVPNPDVVSPDTVKELFAEIERAIDEGYFSIGADFHPDLGYPTSLGYDISPFIADEEWGAGDVKVSRVP